MSEFCSYALIFVGLTVCLVNGELLQETDSYVSVIGDPGMKSPNARFGLEAWNFCNEVGMEAPNMGSPRMADCADLYCPAITGFLFHFCKNGAKNFLGME